VVTAGHCTFGTGLDGEPTEDGSGGNDVWISFAEEPDYSILPPSSQFIPDDNEGRYDAWSAALNASDEWIRATAYPHPEYDDAAFVEHDLGVLVLEEAVDLPEYGVLPTLGLLDELYAEDKQQPYTAVGYGLEGSGPRTSFGGTPGGGRSCGWSTSAAPTASTRRTTWPSWRPSASPPEGGRRNSSVRLQAGTDARPSRPHRPSTVRVSLARWTSPTSRSSASTATAP
jgi:hypothetical protein